LADVVIPRRYCGPADSGNGGWVAGTLAGFVRPVDGAVAEVTLRRPPPLEVPLAVSVDGTRAELRHGEDLLAEVDTVVRTLEPPPAVDAAEAAAARDHFRGHHHHEFPRCFTCGTGRDDGLLLFTGPVGHPAGCGRPVGPLVASTWVPAADLAPDGTVPEPVVWAAMDCPTVWPHLHDGTRALLGRMAARVDRAPAVGEPCVVVGEGTGSEGRKRFGAAAVRTAEGELLAVAAATWLVV
jgi:hypothetical protein